MSHLQEEREEEEEDLIPIRKNNSRERERVRARSQQREIRILLNLFGESCDNEMRDIVTCLILGFPTATRRGREGQREDVPGPESVSNAPLLHVASTAFIHGTQ